MAHLRVGGRFRDGEGATVIWNVAAGARGRRWRWIRTATDGATLSALLETDVDGRPSRLEVAASAGLLVLHPEPDGTEAHGNVVGVDGVRPLAFAWGGDHVFDVADLPWVAIACAGTIPPAGSIGRPALLVDRALRVSAVTRPVAASSDGLPPDGERWPLE